jgi:hypothetical protein
MDDVLKRIMYFEKINEIYSNKLFTIKSIAQHLDLWDSLSVDEKNKLEKITIADSLINGHKDEYLCKLEKGRSPYLRSLVRGCRCLCALPKMLRKITALGL